MSSDFASVVASLTKRSDVSGFTQKRLSGVKSVAAYAAIEAGSDRPALLLELAVDSAVGLVDWPRSQGFVSGLRALGISEQLTHVCVQLTDLAYHEQFLVLVEDLCAELRSATDEKDAVSKCHQRLWQWQIFLKKYGPDGLSDSARAGLFGELHILQNLIAAEVGSAKAVRAWRGCHNADQDFQIHSMAIEVKATRAAVADSVVISNVQQLEIVESSSLFLAVVHLQQSPSEDESLPEMVEKIRSGLTSNIREAFNRGLAEVGYFDAHANIYWEDRYSVRECKFYLVGSGFPRIRASDLAAGIRGVRYQLGLDACEAYRVEASEVLKALASAIGGDNRDRSEVQ